jgi:hypothetical protein
MREEIERVIAELEKQRDEALAKQKTQDEAIGAFKQWGIEIGLENAISKLKAVIAE